MDRRTGRETRPVMNMLTDGMSKVNVYFRGSMSQTRQDLLFPFCHFHQQR